MQFLNELNTGPKKILFTHYGDEWIRGSERCLLDLITHLDREQYEPVVWCNAETMAGEVRKLDVPVIVDQFPLMFGWQAPRFSFSGLRKLIRKGNEIVAKHDIKLLHANSGAPNQWLNFVARNNEIPLVAHLHSRYPMRDRVSLGLHHVSMAVGVSEPVVEQLEQDGMDEEKIHVIPNGIDTERLLKQPRVDLRNQLGINEKDFVIGTVASLIHRKGVDLILAALYRLLKKDVPARLVVIGDGPERSNLMRMAMKLGMQERVYFLGEQPNVVGLLRSGINLFVSGAREEVFGLVLAEAGLAGLSVVAPAVGGIPGVIKDKVTGVLVEPEDDEALADEILTLYQRPERRRLMGEAGRGHVDRCFTIERNASRFEKLYSWMLNDPELSKGRGNNWSIKPVINQAGKFVYNRSLKVVGLGAAGQ